MGRKRVTAGERRISTSFSLSEHILDRLSRIDTAGSMSIVVEGLIRESLDKKRPGIKMHFPISEVLYQIIETKCQEGESIERCIVRILGSEE